MIYLAKWLPGLVMPLGIVIILLLLGIIRRRRSLQVAGLLLLLISSNNMVAGLFMRSAEQWAVRIPISSAPAADAIVVLSSGRSQPPGGGSTEWGDANRFFAGVELFKAGKAPLLVFTGALLPWEGNGETEGAVLAEYAKTLGVPSGRVLVTGRVFNTADEASEVAALLKVHERPVTVLLVTSAFHMARARQLFVAAAISVSPYPVNFSVTEGGRVPGWWLMSTPSALSMTQLAAREFYGRAFNWLRRTVF